MFYGIFASQEYLVHFVPYALYILYIAFYIFEHLVDLYEARSNYDIGAKIGPEVTYFTWLIYQINGNEG